MFTYVILLASVMYLSIKWVSYHRYKKALASPAQMDASLISVLNQEGVDNDE
jgi:hypothetical protein